MNHLTGDSLPPGTLPGETSPTEIKLVFGDEVSSAVKVQGQVLIAALSRYQERNAKYKDNWRRFGWRGLLFRIRERAERLWDEFWDMEPAGRPGASRESFCCEDADDAIDLINFAAMFVRSLEENNRDGAWW